MDVTSTEIHKIKRILDGNLDDFVLPTVHSERDIEPAFNKDALQFENVSDIDWCRFDSALLHYISA